VKGKNKNKTSRHNYMYIGTTEIQIRTLCPFIFIIWHLCNAWKILV